MLVFWIILTLSIFYNSELKNALDIRVQILFPQRLLVMKNG